MEAADAEMARQSQAGKEQNAERRHLTPSEGAAGHGMSLGGTATAVLITWKSHYREKVVEAPLTI